LWNIDSDDFDQDVLDISQPLIDQVRTVQELFIGVSATGFVIILKADSPEIMIRHMLASQDPKTTVHFRDQDNGSTQWQIRLLSQTLGNCNLSFALPDAMLHALNEKRENGRRSAMLNFKEQHFSRITVYRITDEKSLICSLRLNPDWLERARQETQRRPRRSG
jgi:hypothetical protein